MGARRNPDKARYKKPALGGLGGNSLRWSVERDAAVLHPDHQWPFFALLRLDGDGIETPARVDQATLANQPARVLVAVSCQRPGTPHQQKWPVWVWVVWIANHSLDARFGVAYAHRKSIAARLFLATHSHYNFSFIP